MNEGRLTAWLSPTDLRRWKCAAARSDGVLFRWRLMWIATIGVGLVVVALCNQYFNFASMRLVAPDRAEGLDSEHRQDASGGQFAFTREGVETTERLLNWKSISEERLSGRAEPPAVLLHEEPTTIKFPNRNEINRVVVNRVENALPDERQR